MNSDILQQILIKMDDIDLKLINIEKKIDDLQKNNHKNFTKVNQSTQKMDTHIDSIMNIYSGYKGALDYVSTYFPSIGDYSKTEEIEDKK